MAEPPAKAATVYDVAARAGVSIATVSMAFRRPEKVRETTRALVFDAAQALNYVPSASARGLAKGRTGALGLFSYDYLVGYRTAPRAPVPVGRRTAVPIVREGPDELCREFPLYVDEIQRGMEVACWELGYALMIGGPSHSRSDAVVTDIAGRVDGLAVFPQTLSPEALAHVASRIPVVAVSEPPEDDRASHVTVDNRAGTRAVTEHLIIDHGRRDLLFVGGLNPAEAKARFAGFRDALRAAGLRVPRKPLVPPTRPDDAGRAVVALPADLPLPEAFVCATDEVALDVMRILADRGVDVPATVAVTGFDGVAAGRVVRPALTTVRQPMVEMGQAVVDILLAQIAEPARAPEVRELPVEVVLRESCGCPPRSAIWRS
ncbi:LacI family DNA-binding transcriptional regulator [Amycolatopsis mongoliensis]|uniref:LacI family DNA-binding transcriptional regulator n=1 Tax=Amycolatopsis mongoliensis TaxID=715475 RepID=A0A9Y2JH54_9PSEU|nr:LacI family DNA-binding transcriptional regulator [Amycolatopsis sp. 4-36]WIX98540.1 LacI family DNA-binding transcriptional regulator [Amycolatopsis sp. 4-36]